MVTSNEERAAQVRGRYPDTTVLSTPDSLLADPDEHDLVVVATPNRTHVPLVLKAVDAGLHVVVDKPLAASPADGQRLADAAAAAGVVASVFHNRRWDGDFLTLRRLLGDGALGELVRLESRFERWRPEVDAGKWREGGSPEEGGGLLLDLGPHLIDQALELLGPARSVYAEVRAVRPGAEVDDDLFLALEHESGASSHLWASMVAGQVGPRFRALGSAAAYVKHGLDVQEEALRSGAGPRDPGFGEEPREAWGMLGTEERAEPVETEPGRYVAYYEGIEEAIRAAAGASGPRPAGASGEPEPASASGEPPASAPRGPAVSPPVSLAAGVETLRVIEAARVSSAERAVVPL